MKLLAFRMVAAAVVGVAVSASLASRSVGEATAENLALLAAADSGGESQAKLTAAWAQTAAVGADEIPVVLAGMKDATLIGENWLRAAADAIAERELRSGRTLDADALESFVKDQSQSPRARRVAFEWLSLADKAAPDRLLPAMLGDASLELRCDAVQRVIDAAKAAGGADEQRRLYRQAFTAARDIGQIKACSEALRGLDEKVDIAGHMGFIAKWQLLGPFDNAGLAGFATAYPPEFKVDFTGAEQGKNGEVRWKTYESTDDFGKIDLKAAVADDKEVTAYAVATLVAPAARDAQLRMASSNALKLWVNGRQVAAYEIYHTGTDVDQYVVPVELRAGENQVMVKCCQNERKQPWEQSWDFQLRATDQLGSPIDVVQK